MKNYKYIKNLLSLDIAEFITFSSLEIIDKSINKSKTDRQVPLSFFFSSDSSLLYRNLLYFLKSRIEKESNLKLNPTYAYSRFYISGADLKKHTDRPACEISVTLTLKKKYHNKAYQWPLCMGDMPLIIEEGDGVVYKGREIEHWRPVFTEPDGSWHHQVFLHYVNTEGPCKNLKEEIDEESILYNTKLQKKIIQNLPN